MPFSTPEFEHYIAPAKPRAEIWRTAVGLVSILAVYFGIIIGLSYFIETTLSLRVSDDDLNLNTRPSMIVGLLSFGGAIIGVWLVLKLLHKRTFQSLLGNLSDLRKDFVVAATVVLAVNGSWMIVSSYLWGVVDNVPLITVLVFLPVGALLLLIQTGAEEFLFRGYLMQQLAARFRSPIIWFIAPALLFGIVHYDPASMGDVIWWIIAALCLSGLFWADLVRVTGNIGAAWGWHFMNNFLLLNFATIQGSMEGFAWKLTAFGTDDLTVWHILPDMIISVGVWFALRNLLARP